MDMCLIDPPLRSDTYCLPDSFFADCAMLLPSQRPPLAMVPTTSWGISRLLSLRGISHLSNARLHAGHHRPAAELAAAAAAAANLIHTLLAGGIAVQLKALRSHQVPQQSPPCAGFVVSGRPWLKRDPKSPIALYCISQCTEAI
jgi:hypothetical protein